MGTTYACKTCGVVTTAPEQVCKPVEQPNKMNYCGTAPEREAMCHEMREHLAYVCGSCGRPAEQAELLCRPLLIG